MSESEGQGQDDPWQSVPNQGSSGGSQAASAGAQSLAPGMAPEAPGYGYPPQGGMAPGYGYPPQGGMAPGYAYPPQGGMAPQYYYPPVYARKTNGLAVAALVCGICGFVYLIPAILGIVFGSVALRQTRRDGTEGRGMAIAGIVTGSLWLVLVAVIVILVTAFSN